MHHCIASFNSHLHDVAEEGWEGVSVPSHVCVCVFVVVQAGAVAVFVKSKVGLVPSLDQLASE